MVVVKNLWNNGKILTKVALARKVHNNIETKHDIFVSPSTEELNALKLAADNLEAAWNNRKSDAGSSRLNEANEALEAAFYPLAGYVDKIADGTASIIEEAGFTPTKEGRSPAQLPERPLVEKTDALDGGRIKVTVKPVDGAQSYQYVAAWGGEPVMTVSDKQVHIKGASDFVIIADGDHIEEFENLPAGQKVTVWAAAQNTAGVSPFSNPVNKFVQE